MIRLTTLALGTALLVAAGSAYADELQTSPAGAPQMSAVPTVKMEPKPSGGTNTESTHFIRPPGYDQDRWMHPYASGEKPS
jgi:hypothetical protein